jgi:lactate permease
VTWSQNYTPLGGLLPSALVASLPVVVLLVLLGIFHVRAWVAALWGLLSAALVAILVFKMPAQLCVAAAGYGAMFGLFPIGWIVLNAIFIYTMSVETGQFDALKAQIARFSGDRRIQALLIAFSFGAFIEGCAGFGAPVAITGAMMIGLGFRPLEAAKLALIGNTAPVAFGSLGIPLVTLSSITKLDLQALSAMVGRQLPVFSLIVPFWLVAAQVGWRGMISVWPACLVCGATFGLTQFAVSNYHGPWLVDIIAAIVSMISLVALLAFWRPADAAANASSESAPENPPPANRFRAWLPWLLLSVFVALWRVAPVEKWLKSTAPWQTNVPALHEAVQKMPPVSVRPEPEKAIYKFDLLAMTGTALLLAGVTAGFILGIRPGALAGMYLRSLWRVRVSLLTIALMMALGYTDAILRLRLHHGASVCQHRLVVSILQSHAWLAGRRADRQRHVFECPLWQSPASDRRSAWPLADSLRRLQQFRRSDGQNDRRAEHRGGQRRDGRRSKQPERGNDFARRLLAQPGLGHPGRRPRLAAGVRLPLGHSRDRDRGFVVGKSSSSQGVPQPAAERDWNLWLTPIAPSCHRSAHDSPSHQRFATS